MGKAVLLAAWCVLSVGSAHAAQGDPAPTFNKDIAPIIWARCAVCHRPGEIGPFNLITYDDVKRHATQIAVVTAKRLMPPWKPEPGKGEFAGGRRLTDPELRTLQQWIARGAPEGAAADLPPRPAWKNGWQLGTPDLVVTMPEPFVVPAGGGDVFRTFVVPIPTTQARYVRAIEFRPDNARVVHHANLGIDRTRSSRQLDARDPEPGYAGSMVQDARYPEGQLLGWTPGQAPHAAPAGMQWRLEAGSDLVMQLHLQPTGKREPLAVSVGFFFTDDPPTRAPLGLRLGSETIDIAAGDGAYVVSDRYVLPVDVELLAIQPHAHNLARRMEATATRPDGRVEWLIAIDDWDFRWQDVYRYAAPMVLPKGSTVSMRYVYDNSAANPRNPNRPPAHVVWGQNTSDEMGDLWLQVVPRVEADAAMLTKDFRRKAHVDDLAAYTKLLRADPDNPLRHDAVAALYLEDGQIDRAIDAYRASLQLNPSSASTHYNLGIAYSAKARRADALEQFEEAVRIDPDYAQAHNNLGALLQLTGRNEEAIGEYRRAVTLRPDNVEARVNLALLLNALGEPARAVPEFEAAIALRPDSVAALAGLAWLRATTFEAALRDGDKAVTFAERADRASNHRDLGALDALAAAYAATGRFDEAIATATHAVDVATEAGLTDSAARLAERLSVYRRHQPYRAASPR